MRFLLILRDRGLPLLVQRTSGIAQPAPEIRITGVAPQGTRLPAFLSAALGLIIEKYSARGLQIMTTLDLL
jgi:hypothetical protein